MAQLPVPAVPAAIGLPSAPPALPVVPEIVADTTLASTLAKTDIYRDGKVQRLSPVEVKALTGLMLADGTPVLSMARPWLVYELLGAAVLVGIQPLVTAMQNLITDEKITSNANTTLALTFGNPALSKQRNQYLADIDRQKNAISVAVGVKACPKCHSNNTVSIEIQLRSADEPMTQLTSCLDCGKRSKE